MSPLMEWRTPETNNSIRNGYVAIKRAYNRSIRQRAGYDVTLSSTTIYISKT